MVDFNSPISRMAEIDKYWGRELRYLLQAISMPVPKLKPLGRILGKHPYHTKLFVSIQRATNL
jgi:hypothetical protein